MSGLGWRALVFTVALTVLASFPAAAAARPEGLIKELPEPTRVVRLVGGTEGDLWFVRNGKPDSVGWLAPGGRAHAFTLPEKVDPLILTVGAEGSGWFTYAGSFEGYSGGGVGRVTRGGKVSLFPEGPNGAGAPFEIVPGADGNIWFDHAGIFENGGGAIGRITPSGEVTEFSAGLKPYASLAGLIPGEDGNVWFADEGDAPAVGRITQAGEITEFPGLPPEKFSEIRGPAPAGPDATWFAANTDSDVAVERISPDGTISRFRDGLAPGTELLGPFLGSPAGDAWFRDQVPPSATAVDQAYGHVVIGHVSAAGQVDEYGRCLRPTDDYGTARSFVHGGDGNVWFPVWQGEGPKGRSSRYTTPGIARITPSGRITEFRYGLLPGSEPARLVAAGGRIWFLDERSGRIGELRPPRRAANTFLLETSSRRGSVTAIVPGPGRLRVKESGVKVGSARSITPGLSSRTVDVPACGPVTVPVPVSARLRRHLQAKGHLLLGLRVTYFPRGGTPFSQSATMEVAAAGP
jgi:streptogramin lyase